MNLRIIGSGSSGNFYILENKQECLLIEAGVNINKIKQALDFDYSKVVGCLISHEHLDHSKSVNDLIKQAIPVYSGIATLKAKKIDNHHLANEIKALKEFKLGNFKIIPFDLKHDVPCLGFLIDHPECGKTVFITDTYYCKYNFSGLNNIIVEANYSKEILDRKFGPDSDKEFLRNRILRSHFSLENCKNFLKENDLSQVNNIVLIHLSDSNSDERQFTKEVFELTGKNTVAAVNGLEIKFNKTPF